MTTEIQIDLSAAAPSAAENRKEIEIYLTQYLSELRDDLELPLDFTTTLRVTGADGATWGPNLFRAFLDGREIRSQWWPAIAEPGMPAREIAGAIARAVHANRTLLVSAELASHIALGWGIRSSHGYHNGWSAEGFREFLTAFVSRHFGIERGRDFAQRSRTGAAKKREAERCFEQALAASTKLRFGATILLAPSITEDQWQKYAAGLRSWQETLTLDLGLTLPEVENLFDPGLQAQEFRVRLNDVRLPALRYGIPRWFPVNVPTGGLALQGLKVRAVTDPVSGHAYTLVRNVGDAMEHCLEKGIAEAAEISVWSIFEKLDDTIRLHAGSFVSAPLLQFSMDRMKKDSPHLIHLILERFDSIGLTAILRHLLDEKSSIRDLRTIFESLLSVRELRDERQRSFIVCSYTASDSLLVAEGKRLSDLESADYAGCARFGLRSLALNQTTIDKGRPVLPVLLLAPSIDKRLSEACQHALDDEEIRRFRVAVLRAVGSQEARVILCDQKNRRLVRELIRIEFPTIAVLGSREILHGEQEIRAVETISWCVPSADRTSAG